MPWNRRDETQWDDWMKVAEALAKKYGQAFLRVVEQLQGVMTVKELADLLSTQGVDAVVNLLVADPTLFHPLTEALQYSLLTATQEVMAHMPKALAVLFDSYNPKAVDVVRAQGGRLVREVTDGVRDLVRQTTAQGIVLGDNPRTTARVIRGSLGLTATQRQAVANYRKLLLTGDPTALDRALRDKRFDKTVRAWLDGVRTVDPQKVDDMVARYEQRYLKYRAETIARNEALTALGHGQRLAWEAVFDAGKASRDTVRRFWHVARDERTCEYCKPVPKANLKGVAFDEPFQTPLGPKLQAPIHVQCRCVVFIRPIT